MIGDEQNSGLNDIGWALLLAGFRVAAGVTFMGTVATIGALLNAIDAHQLVNPLVWLPLAGAVVLAVIAMLKRVRGGAGRPGIAAAAGGLLLAGISLSADIAFVEAPHVYYFALPPAVVILATGAFLVESIARPRRITGPV